MLQDPSLRVNHLRLGVTRGRVTLHPGSGPAILGGERVRDVLPVFAGESFQLGDTALTLHDSIMGVEEDPEDTLGEMVGPSRVMRHTFSLIRRFAPHGYPVLIIGESGTGKELAARTIHDEGPRSSGPFVAINCGAITENLIESELFGHEKGAFTGADERREGAFQRADGGTLFLDELGEMTPTAQVKMLRTLQTGGVRRVGGARVEYPDVRVVGATNRDLTAALGEGSFRLDLLPRLAALTLHLPPLRDRMEDLPALAGALCERIDPDAAKPIRLSAEAMSLLRTHNWPGNVRELRNVLIRAYVTGGPLIQPAAIQFSPWSFSAVSQAEDDRGGDLLEQQERRLLQEALIRHKGNRSAVARELGIARSTLHYKLRRFGLDRL